MIIFGYAIRTDVDHVRLAIVDPAPDYATLALRSRFARDRTCSASSRSCRAPPTLEPLFQRGDAQEAVVFEPGFAERLAAACRRGC